MKVSIVVPIYNIAEYVSDTLTSLINQTYADIEILAVDDGSTDNSGKICDDFALKDKRIKVIHKQNGGLSSARNAGIDVAAGEYIMFLDGDDRLVNDAVERLVQLLLENPDADLIQFTYSEVDANGVPLYPYAFSQSVDIVEREKEKFERLYKMGGPAASACTKLCKRALFEGLRFYEGIIHEDEYIVTDILSRTKKVIYFDAALYLYYFRNGSIITSSFTPKKLDIFKVFDKRIGVLYEKGYTDLLQREWIRVFETIIRLYCGAKSCGYNAEALAVKKRLSDVPYDVKSGMGIKQRIIFIACKRCNFFINIIYLFKKILKREG